MDRKKISNIIKAGMTLSMFYLVWSGMGRRKAYRDSHIIAGITLIGLSIWHYNLYNPFLRD